MESEQIAEFSVLATEDLSHFAPLSSLSSAAAVFSIPKILERIFSYSDIDPQDLLRFRLVSRDWRREATNDTLLNWNLNKIRIETNRGALQTYHCNQDRKFSKPLQELIELMNNTGSNTFPCFHFHLNFDRTNNDDEEELMTFLNNHGHRIKYLFLNLNYYKRCDEIPDVNNTWCSHSENWCNHFITKLLSEKVPNLEWLKFVLYTIKTLHGTPCTPLVNTNLQTIDDTVTVEGINLNLQTVSLLHNIPKSLFELFRRLAPNLKTLAEYDLSHYIEPINRLHLLTSLTYRPGSWRPEWTSLVERIVNMDTELQVTELFINTVEIREISEDWLHVADICNKLFTKCARSLKKLTWSRMRFLPGLKIPQMPNVHYLTLTGGGFIAPDMKFFPLGMRISEVFPKLHTIQLNCNYSDVAAFGNELLLGCGEQSVPSVRVIMGRWIDSTVFQRIFPSVGFDNGESRNSVKKKFSKKCFIV